MTGPVGLALQPGDETPIIEYGSGFVSRGALRARADALVALLRSRGIRRALVSSDDPAHILRAMDACNRAGADLFVAHTGLRAGTVEEIIAEHRIGLRIGDEDSIVGDGSDEPASASIFMMTSGTTGHPKIARHDLGTLLGRIRDNSRLSSMEGSKWLLTYQPTGFAGVQVQLTATLAAGVIVSPDTRTPSGFYEAARRAGVTQISATPTFWRSFLMVAEPGAIALRQATLGGEAADQATLDRIRRHYPQARVTHIYASTEAGVVFAVNDGRAGFPAVWLDEGVQDVQLRLHEGYLHIRTPHVMRGYLSAASQPLLDDGWLATADLCIVDGDRIRILGRQDSSINVAGSKVYPLEVETFLLGLDGVAEARVYGEPNPISGFIVAADIILSGDEDPRAARKRILAACRGGLAGYQVPRAVTFVDMISTGASGKKG
ncbi:MAG: hypothetical protein B7Z22_01755 [Hyphomonas sp. 32-62-5]|nr:MAG: hypothetical protein B7Z22_01755 [Hyphomonas sp. 32-62-5]